MASESDRKAYREGPEAAERFDRTMARVLTVSKDELNKREAMYQKARARKTRPRRSSR
jgi:hypothetical protein